MLGIEQEYLEKYASYADSLLNQNYGDDYTVEDVEKLASVLIDYDLEKAAEAERVEFLVKSAQIQARAFADEFVKIAGWDLFEKFAANANMKNINKILEGAFGKGVGKRLHKMDVVKVNKALKGTHAEGKGEYLVSHAKQTKEIGNRARQAVKRKSKFRKIFSKKPKPYKPKGKTTETAYQDKILINSRGTVSREQAAKNRQTFMNRSSNKPKEAPASAKPTKTEPTKAVTTNANKPKEEKSFTEKAKRNFRSLKRYTKANPWGVGGVAAGGVATGAGINTLFND